MKTLLPSSPSLAFCALLFLRALATAADPGSGLVGHWRFDGGDGRTVKDLSPRGNDGVIEAGVPRQEKGAGSLEFDGLGSHVIIEEKSAFGFSNAITASLWVKPFELRKHTVFFGVPHTTDSWTTPMFGMYANEGRAVFGMWGSRGVPKVLVETPAELPLQTWSLLTATYDGATVKLYLNGAPAAEAPHTGEIVRNGQPLILGRGLGDAKPSLKGRIGELRLYACALTAEEVRALFEQTKSAFDLTGPAGAKFRDGTVIVESSGTGNAAEKPWRKYPTRLLESLDGYKPSGASVELNRYGGRLDRPKEKATGFFRVTKTGGRRWLIDPEGCRYFNVAINGVREPKDVNANFGFAGKWAEATTTLLRESGFNGLGNGSSTRMQGVRSPLPWVLRTNFMFEFAKKKGLTEPASGTVGFRSRAMPVFHPDFEEFCEQFAKGLEATANDPSMLGIMTDNELQCPVDLLDRYLSLDAGDPGHQAAAAWFAERKGAGSASITLRDRYQFIAFAFERYYRLVTTAIRKYDRNHLYLGSRINYHQGEFDNPWFWKMLAPFHDVVSVNYYGFWGPQQPQFADWEAWGGRPVLLTEWYAKAQDAPGLANTNGAGWLVRTQQDRARYYQHFALNALEIKNIVGWHWFKYADDPKESTALDSAGGANKGMFDSKGRAWQPVLDAARAVNREAYPLIEFFDAREQVREKR